jgi:hypothetical protein
MDIFDKFAKLLFDRVLRTVCTMYILFFTLYILYYRWCNFFYTLRKIFQLLIKFERQKLRY